MMKSRFIVSYINIIMCSLLCLFPLGAVGQTTTDLQPSSSAAKIERLAETLKHLEVCRGPHRFSLPNGLSDLLSMNYVDGYSFGPHFVYSYTMTDRCRWEIEPTLRWASGRDQWVGKASLRYFWPVEQQRYVELYGGQTMEDFDEQPAMPMQHSLMASGLFGWNHYKLLERTQAGVRVSSAVNGALLLTGDVRWERRRAQENSRDKNVFGATAESNVPRIRDVNDEPALTLYDGPVNAELVKVGLQLDFMQHKTLYVVDDVTAFAFSHMPHYSLKLDMGQGVGKECSDMRFISLDLSMQQLIRLEREHDRLRYYVGAGAMWHQGEIGLADWHHLDASRFWWQRTDGLTRFALLDNYELSTDRWWSEAHVEWSSPCMLLTRLMRDDTFRETLQLHIAQVADRQTHWECQYGWDLARQMQLGVTVGFDRMKYSGVTFGFMLPL